MLLRAEVGYDSLGVEGESGGTGRNRTGIRGFAVLYITILPPRHLRTGAPFNLNRGGPQEIRFAKVYSRGLACLFPVQPMQKSINICGA